MSLSALCARLYDTCCFLRVCVRIFWVQNVRQVAQMLLCGPVSYGVFLRIARPIDPATALHDDSGSGGPAGVPPIGAPSTVVAVVGAPNAATSVQSLSEIAFRNLSTQPTSRRSAAAVNTSTSSHGSGGGYGRTTSRRTPSPKGVAMGAGRGKACLGQRSSVDVLRAMQCSVCVWAMQCSVYGAIQRRVVCGLSSARCVCVGSTAYGVFVRCAVHRRVWATCFAV